MDTKPKRCIRMNTLGNLTKSLGTLKSEIVVTTVVYKCSSLLHLAPGSRDFSQVEKRMNTPTPWLTLLLVLGKSRVNQKSR